jgi:predicted signal transduction protein with EAL and GGDEF domain
VVAEGVENPSQLAFLRAHGCPEGQGFLLGRPVTAKQMARLLGVDSTGGSRALGVKQGGASAETPML